MTGPADSVLGVESGIIIDRLRNHSMGRFMLAEGECCLEGVLITVDKSSGKATDIKLINIR